MLNASPITGSMAPLRSSLLRDSVLSSSFDAEELLRFEELGEIIAPPSGATIFERGAPSDFLYVVLDGALLPASPSGDPPRFWVGPGDVCGEMGFVLGAPRSTTMMAFGPAPRLWRIHRDVLSRSGVAITRMLAALSRVVLARLEAPTPASASWAEADYCDHDHPRVAAMARRLARPTPLETAHAIWAELWKMPYRFGTWQWTASETAARGYGMCTTKAILQVALMRALGVECGYVKGELDGPLVRACMPRVYHPRFQRPTFKHYYAAARIDGRWIPLDGSFSRGSLGLIAETEHHVKSVVEWDAMVHGFASAAGLRGMDPFDIVVHDDITEVMRKAATYDAKNALAMNVRLDRAQSFAAPVPVYAEQAERALAYGSHEAARALLLFGLAADADELRRREAPAKAA
jgi:CRP-like cAMP-binding protein